MNEEMYSLSYRGAPHCIACGCMRPCACSDAWRRFCWYAFVEKWNAALPVLATNLTIAAWPCAADDIGHHNGYRDGFYVGCGRMIDNDGEWHPGCGRPAPGWGRR